MKETSTEPPPPDFDDIIASILNPISISKDANELNQTTSTSNREVDYLSIKCKYNISILF
jgi:hypothetical protein